MGFDFYWVHEPPEVEALERAVRALEMPAPTYELLPGWQEANLAYWEARRKHGTHWGGVYGWFHDAIEREMIRLGMVYSTPDMETALRRFRHPKDHEWANDDCCDAAKLFHHWREDLGPKPEQGIPCYKFQGSDGWLVHPEEITSALRRFEEAREDGWSYQSGDEDDAKWFNKWLRFMYCARGYGGFRTR